MSLLSNLLQTIKIKDIEFQDHDEFLLRFNMKCHRSMVCVYSFKFPIEKAKMNATIGRNKRNLKVIAFRFQQK